MPNSDTGLDAVLADASSRALEAFLADDYQAFVESLQPYLALSKDERLKHRSPSYAIPSDVPLLCVAALQGRPFYVKALLQAGAHPSECDFAGRTPAMYAIMGGSSDDHENILYTLYAHPDYQNRSDSAGATEFDWAIRCCNARLGLIARGQTLGESNRPRPRTHPLIRQIEQSIETDQHELLRRNFSRANQMKDKKR